MPVLVDDDMMRIEQAEHLVVSYPCLYESRQRRITERNASGRQQYIQRPVVQLVFWVLALVHTVWRMPLYRRPHEPRRALATLQTSLWPEFAD